MSYAGNITKRKHKKGYSWELCVELPKDPVTGKRIRKTKTVRGSKKEAERALHEFITELERGIYVEDDKICISEWIKTLAGRLHHSQRIAHHTGALPGHD